MAKRGLASASRWRQHLASAPSPEHEMATAYDWLRTSLSRLSRPRRDRRAEAFGREEAHRLMQEAARTLARLAEQAIARSEGDAQ